ncbi:two-component system, OmpR family, phosphate regulon response regulator PhoB [Noviherbaspirillum humi]|uniref:Phosphate regulon transcriptional regulatory protein PhoB n=1 Tax=Noviherbaspirillum humi TaxID=1688639 RepID=A0A239GWI6_9BURK|nr:phosphate regulon transcriptional regulator PhoB [Noviherbaspirillum humi]SNS73487.1 two-component system, OmpR family, phosphate regulon response regulator PhoB [Noviherbaspirillum humi]
MPVERNTVLLVEDEPAIVELVRFSLQDAGIEVIVATSAEEALERLQQRLPHLLLLDWMLPGESGLQFLRRLRAQPRLQALPVIMLTAKSMEEDKIAGLDGGADDYITKPFSPRELVSRIRALLRRRLPEQALEAMEAGPILLDPATCSVTVDGRRAEIGQAEYRLLKFLMAHGGRVFSRSQLLDKVWGDHVAIEERTVDVHILRLRKALGDGEAWIQTVRGVGYRFADPASAS